LKYLKVSYKYLLQDPINKVDWWKGTSMVHP